MTAGMIGFRCNFATMDEDGLVTDRRAGRISGTNPLSAAIREGVDLSALGIGFRFESGAGHRAALALIGEDLGDAVSSNDPKGEGISPPPIRACSDAPADARTAQACNEFIRQSAEILAAHPLNEKRLQEGLPPANFLLLRGAGKMGAFPPFQERYGLSGSVISAATLISGIGKVVGLEHIPVPGTTGSVDSDLDAKVRATWEPKKKICLQTSGRRWPGHVVQKRDFIEVIDAALGPLLAFPGIPYLSSVPTQHPCPVRDHRARCRCHQGLGVRVDRRPGSMKFRVQKGPIASGVVTSCLYP